MQIAIGADHAGYSLKCELIDFLRQKGYEALDLGTHSTASVDFPDYARAVGEALLGGQAKRGILICGSGVGVCIAANKIPGVRAAVCHDHYSAHQGVEHDDMNVLVLGARIIGPEPAKEICCAFLAACFEPNERFVRRLNKVKALEQYYLKTT